MFKCCAYKQEAQSALPRSILRTYYHKLKCNNGYNFSNTIVQSKAEFQQMVEEICVRCPVHARVAVLEGGLSIENMQLRKGLIKLVEEKTEVHEPGYIPDFQLGDAGVVDMPQGLVPDFWKATGPLDANQRFQVVSEDLLPEAERNAKEMLKDEVQETPEIKKARLLSQNESIEEYIVAPEVQQVYERQLELLRKKFQTSGLDVWPADLEAESRLQEQLEKSHSGADHTTDSSQI